MESESELYLLCDENISDTIGTLSPPSSAQQQPQVPPSAALHDISVDMEDLEEELHILLGKQSHYLPRSGFGTTLLQLPLLAALRCNSVLWIVMTCARLFLGPSTVFTAVNLLDMFVSRYVDKEWEDWMMELASVACVSISSKFTEVAVPDLDAFQMPINVYSHITIQRMELLVLQALDWHIHSVTAHSYTHLLLHKNATSEFVANTYDLLLRSLLDVRFLDHKPFDVAMAAIKCTVESGEFVDEVADLIADRLTETEECDADMEICYEILLKSSRTPMVNSDGFCPGAMYKPSKSNMKMSDRVLRIDWFFFDSGGNGRGDDESGRKRKRV